MRQKLALLVSCFPLLIFSLNACAQKPQGFNRREIMIPMRDGVRLQTAVFVPRNAKDPLPFLIVRTPYGIPPDDRNLVSSGNYDELIADGYIFVFQNLRGRFKSEGQFVMQRAPRDRSDSKSIDEGTDAYDTIDWLIKNISGNNGRAGIYGVSYSGWTTVMALLEPHPALKAASEQASPADMFLGDDFHHNGAFRLSYGFEYAALLETAKETNTNFKFDKFDTYEWYLDLGALSNANAKYFHGSLPTWNDFVHHPDYDDFWKKQVFASYLHKTTVPNLNVAGWWDQEDFYGPMKVYELLEKNDDQHLNYLVAGPWNHGGWAHGAGISLGSIDFDSNTAKFFRVKVQAPWFAYWLHDKDKKDKLTQPEALTFQTGSNQWKSYDAWPPVKGIQKRQLYFHANGKLSFAPPTDASAAFDSYISDPANPVPYRRRPISPTYPGPDWPVWLLQDQRFVDHRPDVLTWQTEPLTQDVAVAGDIVANLYASTSGSDSDWIVKLIDVYPQDYTHPVRSPECAQMDRHAPQYESQCVTHLGGYQLIIADEVFRGRFRAGFEHSQPLAPDQPLEYHIDLHTNNHAFLKGHRIMVQVQSTWFPLIDRNPQKYVPNIFEATDSDYIKATQKVYRNKDLPSNILLPVESQ